MYYLILWVLFCLFLVAVFFIGYHKEKRAWNNGRCPKCNAEWEHFDTDSQGGRGYKCSAGCGYGPWISYPVDKTHSVAIQQITAPDQLQPRNSNQSEAE
jgi:hypothetical protein